MDNYESVIIIDSNLKEEKIQEEIKKYQDLIEKNGSCLEIETMGEKRLAYEINGHKEGYYVVFNFSATNSFRKKLEKEYKEDNYIIRSLVINK